MTTPTPNNAALTLIIIIILSLLEGVEERHHEVDDDGKVERHTAPQRHVTAEPEQQRIG
jgi:hypothetical protein